MHQTVIFVLVVIIACNAVLYPSLFSTIFRMWFGFSTPKEEPEPMPEYPPHMRGRMPGGGPPRKSQFSSGNNEAAAYMARQKQEGSSHGMMGTILPVYAVGIFIYFGYVIYKIFLKDKPTKAEDPWGPDDNDADTYGPTLERQQQEHLQRQLAAELRAANYDGMGGHKRRTRGKGQGSQLFTEDDTQEPVTPSSGNEDIDILKQRLERTERTMDRMMEMMNNMGVAFNRVTEQLNIQTDGPISQSKRAPKEDEEEAEDDVSTEEEEAEDEIELDEESWSEEEMGERINSEEVGDEGRVEDIKMKQDDAKDGSVRRRKVAGGEED